MSSSIPDSCFNLFLTSMNANGILLGGKKSRAIKSRTKRPNSLSSPYYSTLKSYLVSRYFDCQHFNCRCFICQLF